MDSLNKIHRLRVLCGGVGNDSCYGHQFSPIKSCKILLSVEGFDKAVNDPSKSSSSWIRLARGLLVLIEQHEKFRVTFIKLLKLILDNRALDGRDDFLFNIWKKTVSSSLHFQITEVEEFMKREPKFIELKVISIVEDVFSKDCFKLVDMNTYWIDNENAVLIRWCLESTVIFCIVTSIMNELLLQFSNKKFIQILNLIKSFIFNLLKKRQDCEEHFINLYPLQYRHLIYLLKSMPVCNKSFYDDNTLESLVKEISEIIQDELNNRPEVIIMLISHYFAWFDKLSMLSTK